MFNHEFGMTAWPTK